MSQYRYSRRQTSEISKHLPTENTFNMMATDDPESFQISSEKEKELLKIFSEHPEADDDKIPQDKVNDVFLSCGYILGSEYDQKLQEKIQEECGEMVSYEDVKNIFTELIIKKLNVDFFKNLFRILDKKKEGIIPAENLKKILSQLPDTDEDEVDEMIAAIDDDGNGEVSFDEFFSLMCDE